MDGVLRGGELPAGHPMVTQDPGRTDLRRPVSSPLTPNPSLPDYYRWTTGGGSGPAPSGEDEPRGYFGSTTVACSMMTGSTGTSRMPWETPVLTLAMASTTSIPSTTLPNTQ